MNPDGRLMQRAERVNASINLSRLLSLNPCIDVIRISIYVT
jgi:hypothetical protein